MTIEFYPIGTKEKVAEISSENVWHYLNVKSSNRAGCNGGGNVQSSSGKALLNGLQKVSTNLIGLGFIMLTKKQKGSHTNKRLERWHTNG